jgi:ATP-dependent DNA helicase RecQ
MVVMPTGSGKSLCFQLPAVVRHEETGGGVALVFSPLIALMEDQVAALKAKGIRATYINSTLKRGERERRCKALGEGAYELVYATPERMEREIFVSALQRVPGGVTLLAIDEAHCISKWGHDLRPAYREVGRFREVLGNPVTIALTATATPQVREDIRRVLGFGDAEMSEFSMPVDRENLCLRAREVWSDAEKIDRLREVADEMRGTGIVYFTLIKDLVRFADLVRKQLPLVRVGMYHGKLDARDKKRVYEAFSAAHQDERLMLLATNAFGMGVDKADIRYIVHAQMPGSVEAYHQEVGRAGRDGEPAVCELLYMQEDLAIQQEFVDWMNPSADLLVQISAELERHPHDDVDADDMRLAILGKGQGGGRVDYAMIALEHIGVVEDSPIPGRYRFVRPIKDEELDLEDLGAKRGRDLHRLVDMVQMIRGDQPREYVRRYFEGD